jgi:hypothetical protein
MAQVMKADSWQADTAQLAVKYPPHALWMQWTTVFACEDQVGVRPGGSSSEPLGGLESAVAP